jgi:teichoic acid transport system ATP-binding protein
MEAIRNLGRRSRSTKEIHALKKISFDVKAGTVLGVVGANGAGKSTLMRTIGGIIPPTSGEVEVYGDVSAMLSLGVGFNPGLSGRENIFLGGLAAGLSREEVVEKYDKIVAFAELEEFIDMPMRAYSAGMYGRLAFSVATSMNPDILIIDEALSTGDASFKEKSGKRIQELCEEVRTLLIVSHALGTVEQLCNDAIWLHKGELILRDEPKTVIEAYKRFLNVGDVATVMEDF